MSLQIRLNSLITAIGADVKALSTAVAGKAAAVHTHVATTDLTATGTKNSTTFLRGDNTFNNAITGPLVAPSIGGGAGDLKMDTHIAGNAKTIWGLMDPVNADHAANKKYVDQQDALKANASHTHVATTDLTATGTKDATTFLRGDNTWGVPSGGISQTTADGRYINNGTVNSDVELLQSMLMETDTRSLTFGYTGSDLTSIVEKDGSTTMRTMTIAYSSGKVSTITEVAGGKTSVTTLVYTGADLTSVTRSVT